MKGNLKSVCSKSIRKVGSEIKNYIRAHTQGLLRQQPANMDLCASYFNIHTAQIFLFRNNPYLNKALIMHVKSILFLHQKRSDYR